MRGFTSKKGNKWYAVVYLGINDQTGKKIYKWHSGFDTKRAAQQFLSEQVVAVNQGTYQPGSKETFASFVEKWSDYKKSRVKSRTLDIYKRTLEYHVLDPLGRIELTKLKPLHLQNLYSSLEEKLSNRYILQIHTILHDILKTAVKWELLNRNPADSVDPPRPEKFKGKTWTIEESQRFLETAKDHRFYVLFLLALTTGMRQGELLALRWSDVDLKRGMIRVERSLSTNGAGRTAFNTPKTESSRRTILITSEVVDALKAHREEQYKQKEVSGKSYVDLNLITARINGNVVSQSYLRQSFIKLIESADVPEIRFHDLRHTNATLLLQQGIATKIVSDRLGHANTAITSDTYQHVLPEMQRSAAEGLSQALFPTKKVIDSNSD